MEVEPPPASVAKPDPRRDFALTGILLLPAGLLSLAAAGPGVLPGDVAVDRWVEGWPTSWLDWIVRGLNAAGAGWIGFTLLTLVFMVLLILRRQRRLALFVGLASLTRLVSTPLKTVIASGRPTPDLVRITETQPDYGFPSGHTFGATVLFGALFIILPGVVPNVLLCRLLRGLCLVMILLMGIARIRVGAHWPSDVLGGMLWGVTVLALLSALSAIWVRRVSPPPPVAA